MTFTERTILQVKTLMPILAISYAILLLLLASVAMIAAHYDISIANFTRDPMGILNGHPFTGVLSHIGVLFWCATAAVCFFSSVFHLKKKDTEISLFLLFSGLLTLFLLLDDLFMFHEAFFPIYLHVPQTVVYLGYFILISLFFIRFARLIFRTEYTVLYMACGFFALSLACDVILPQQGMEFLLEDGFKLFGIVTWFIFFIRTCFSEIEQLIDR